MPTPVSVSPLPYTVPGGETDLDTQTLRDALLSLSVTVVITGTKAQLQADYNTLLATNLSAPSTVLWNHEV